MIPLFEGAAETRKIKRSTFKNWVVSELPNCAQVFLVFSFPIIFMSSDNLSTLILIYCISSTYILV